MQVLLIHIVQTIALANHFKKWITKNIVYSLKMVPEDQDPKKS